MSMTEIHIGEFLRRMRVARGLSITQIAQRAALIENHYQRWESGEEQIPVRAVPRILDAFGWPAHLEFQLGCFSLRGLGKRGRPSR